MRTKNVLSVTRNDHYTHAAVGGTFAYFHKGHEKLLETAFVCAKHVTVGITADTFVASYKDGKQSFSDRKKAVLAYLRKKGWHKRVTFFRLHNRYGPTIDPMKSFDVLIVSKETATVVKKINKQRNAVGLIDLDIMLSPSVLDEDGKLLSTTRIHQGIIDRKGKRYIPKEWYRTNHKLPFALRETLRKPFGRLFSRLHLVPQEVFSKPFVTVGDIITKSCTEAGYLPTLAVVDLHSQRGKYRFTQEDLGLNTVEERYTITNAPGYISGSALELSFNIFAKEKQEQQKVVLIDGEEDLLVIPIVLAAPLGTKIIYGQPEKGVVLITVTEKKKQVAKTIMQQCEHQIENYRL